MHPRRDEAAAGKGRLRDAANLKVDPGTGSIVFESNTKAGKDADSTPTILGGQGNTDKKKSPVRGIGAAPDIAVTPTVETAPPAAPER